MARIRDDTDWFVILTGIFVAGPLLITALVGLIALCYAIVWHIGHWVSWW